MVPAIYTFKQLYTLFLSEKQLHFIKNSFTGLHWSSLEYTPPGIIWNYFLKQMMEIIIQWKHLDKSSPVNMNKNFLSNNG